MTIFCFVLGAFMVGYLVPEFTVQWGAKVQAPLMQNMLAAFGFALMAYGLRG